MLQNVSKGANTIAAHSTGAKALNGASLVTEAVAACNAALLYTLHYLALSREPKQRSYKLAQHHGVSLPPLQLRVSPRQPCQQQLSLASQQVLQQMHSLHQQHQPQLRPLAKSLLLMQQPQAGPRSQQQNEQQLQAQQWQHAALYQQQPQAGPQQLCGYQQRVQPQQHEQQHLLTASLLLQPHQHAPEQMQQSRQSPLRLWSKAPSTLRLPAWQQHSWQDAASVAWAAAQLAGCSVSGIQSPLRHMRHQHGQADRGNLFPYQMEALTAAEEQIKSTQQRITLRLPPSAAIQPILAQLVTRYVTTHSVLVLISSSDRALALKAALKPLLESARINPRLIPGDLIRRQHPVVIVDLQQLQQVPSAMIHLQQQQQSVQQGLAIYEEGFMLQQEEAAGFGSVPGSSSSSSSNQGCYLYDSSLRQLAEQILRNLRYMEPNPNKPIITLSSRGWHETLCQQQQQQLLRSGLIRAIETIRIPTGTQLPAIAGGSGGAVAAGYLPHALSRNSQISSQRSTFIAQSFNPIAGTAGKGLVIAARDQALGLDLALNLAGVSSLVLHDEQSPEDQAAVLNEFNTGNDRALVTGLAAEQMAVIKLNPGLDLSAVLVTTPVFDAQEYVARLAPALLHAPPSSAVAAGAAEGAAPIRVTDFVDVWAETAAAAAAAAQDGRVRRRRRSRSAAADTATHPAAAAAAGSIVKPLTCGDVLGGICHELPIDKLPALIVSATTTSSWRTLDSTTAAADQQQDAAAAASKQQQQPRVQGDLIWVLLDDGSWAIPIKRGRGITLAGMRILWLTKTTRRGWIPQLEEGFGEMVPLPGTTGKPINLQKARTLAEAWMKSAYPTEAAVRELGLEWRERPMTDSQIMFCDRHNIPYDARWTRGTVNNTIDRYVVETMREPPTGKQLFLVKHFAPYASSSMTNRNSSLLSYRTAAEHLLQRIMTGDFGGSSSSKRSEKFEASSAIAAAVAAARDGSSSSGDGVLPARQALLNDQEAIWNAGLRPKYTWMVLNGSGLLLDLMTGCYLWVQLAAAVGSGTASSSSTAGAAGDPEGGQMSSASSTTTTTTAAAAAAATAAAAVGTDQQDAAMESTSRSATLNPSGLYHVRLQLPEGSFHPVSIPAAAALITQYTSSHTPAAAAAAIPGGSSAPLLLAAAVDRAEKIAQSLISQHQAFLGRDIVRIAGMVGGWKAPPKASEAHMAMPASARQLEALRAYGLPANKRYTCVDAHRELVRHMKNNGLPEPAAMPAQLARIRELQLPLPDSLAARLTSAEAKAMLFRVQLAGEQAIESKRPAPEKKARRVSVPRRARRF